MAIYMRKPTQVSAEQFTSEALPPRGIRTNAPDVGQYVVVTMQGRLVPVSVGEWIVAESDGEHFYPIADSEFRRIYEPVAVDQPTI